VNARSSAGVFIEQEELEETGSTGPDWLARVMLYSDQQAA
jgi:hypothetical protein